MTESCYRIDLAYIGTRYSGFQSQTDNNAIQNHVEKALATFFRHPVRIKGASRTDRGVHAEQQVLVFKTSKTFDPKLWRYALNGILPKDIAVLKINPIAASFNPIRHACGKAYRYRMWLGKNPHPFIRDFVWPVLPQLDVERLHNAAQYLVGFHDFTSFCNADSDAKTKTRRIFAITVQQKGPLIDFWIIGEGFLKQMVRTIVGTLYDLSLQDRLEDLPSILAKQDRKAGGQTAPAKGLSLVAVFYDKVESVEYLTSLSEAGYSFAL